MARKAKSEKKPEEVQISPAVEKEVNRLSKEIRKFVAADLRAQREFVEGLMVEGAKLRQIARLCRERWPNISVRTVKLRMEQVRTARREEAKEDRVERREMMIDRLNAYRQKALLEKKVNWKAVAMFEREIAKLAGLYAPQKLEVGGQVQHSHAMLAVMSSMDPELASEMLREAKETELLAKKARELLPARLVAPSPTEIIDVLPEALNKGT